MTKTEIVPLQIEEKIITIRNQNVVLDRDVAEIYGVETKRINEAVKNNPDKFPDGYVFRLKVSELNNLKTLTLNSKQTDNQEPVDNFDRLLNIKHVAETNAFTEKGLYMLATILKSPQATNATIEIIEAFAKLKQLQNSIAVLNSTEPEVIKPEAIESTGNLFNDLFFSYLPTTSAETSFEFNLGVVKGKRSLRSEIPNVVDRIQILQKESNELKKMLEEIKTQLQK